MWPISPACLHHLCNKVGIITERQICSHCSIPLRFYHHSLTTLSLLLQGIGTIYIRTLICLIDTLTYVSCRLKMHSQHNRGQRMLSPQCSPRPFLEGWVGPGQGTCPSLSPTGNPRPLCPWLLKGAASPSSRWIDQVLRLSCICSKACLWYNPSCSGHVTETRVYLRLLISSSVSCRNKPELASLFVSPQKQARADSVLCFTPLTSATQSVFPTSSCLTEPNVPKCCRQEAANQQLGGECALRV